MIKRFFISTKASTPLKIVKKLLGEQCYSAFLLLSSLNNIYFISLDESIDQNVFQQKMYTIFPDMQIFEIDNSFEYTEKYIYINPLIPIEELLDAIFIGGWSIEGGENDLYIKVTSSRDEDCFNLACFLKYLGIVFSSSLGQFPVVEIQNLPLGFNVKVFNEMNERHINVPISFSKFLDDGKTCTGFVLTSNMQNSYDLIRSLNNATISNNKIKAFLKFLPQSPAPSDSKNLYLANNQNQAFPLNQQMQSKPSSSQNNVKEVKIYPASFSKTIHIKQPSYVDIDDLRKTAEKYGKIDRLSIIKMDQNYKVFEVVFNKNGSCDTILKSNEFRFLAKRADLHLSNIAITPVIQYFPKEKNQPSNLDLFDIISNTVIVALDKDYDLEQFAKKMQNFGVFSRILYQAFEDRKEVAVTFSTSGSTSTFLKCKEFLNSAALADDLYKYRLQQKTHNLQQQQIPNSFNFPPQQQNVNCQPPNFIFNIQQAQQQQAPLNPQQIPIPFNQQQTPLNPQQIPIPFNQQQAHLNPQQIPIPFNQQQQPDPFSQQMQFFPNQHPSHPPIAQQQQQQGQKLILSSSHNSYASQQDYI